MEQVIAFFIGLVSATIGSIATGGGLISVPGLMFLGLTPASAIATTRLNLLGGGGMAVYRYNKEGAVLKKHMAYFLVVAVIAGVVGPRLLLGFEPAVIERTIGIILLIMLPFIWYKKDAGTINVIRSRRRHILGLLAVAIVMFYSTMIGAGGGIFLIYALVYFYGMTVIEATATGLAITLLATAVALITYIGSGAVDWSLGIPSTIGAIIGGYIGANWALKNGVFWVKVILTFVILVAGVKLALF